MTRAHTSVFNFANTDKLELHSPFHIFPTHRNTSIPSLQRSNTANMAAKNLPPAFNATSQDIEMLLSAQCHIGSKNLQVHMEPICGRRGLMASTSYTSARLGTINTACHR